MNNYTLGCLKDPQDKNDLLLSSYLTPKTLPKAISWFDMAIPLLNQGEDPACVGYSGVGLKREHEKLETKEILTFSGLDLYNRCKAVDGMPDEKGTFIRVMLKLLQNEGLKDAEGNTYKIGPYVAVKNVDELRYAITANGFAIIGVEVFENFFNPVNGIIDYKEGLKSGGLHAILVGGFDDINERMPFKNSWGPAWGLGGYGYLTYRYIEKTLNDGWTAVDVNNEKSPASNLLNFDLLKKDLNTLKIN